MAPSMMTAVPKPCAIGAEGRALRDIFGQFASGVTIIAAGAEKDVHGMTANAFMSVSLDPPLILVSLKNDSNMRQKIEADGRFSVSILAEEQKAASEHFSGRAENAETALFEHQAGAPVVAGALAWISCSVEQQHVAGDHTLIIARVDAFAQSSGAPLLFFGGEYRTLNHEVHAQ